MFSDSKGLAIAPQLDNWQWRSKISLELRQFEPIGV
jgi:hypothetical protein